MSPNPRTFLDHLRQEAYHLRSNKHSNVLAQAIVKDLIAHCPAVAQKGAAGQIVFDLNHTIMAGTSEWNVDLVLGPPPLDVSLPASQGELHQTPPSTVEIAIEIKSVMTEHRKAVKNRKRDLEAHHEHVHNYNNQAVAGGVLVINVAPRFHSPLRSQTTEHTDPHKLAGHCISELRSVSARGGTKGYGLEARCAILLALDNISTNNARYRTASPAPAGR